MTQYHFISGLPRSGTTLLSAILQQNPMISSGIISPAATILVAMQKAVSNSNEASAFLSKTQKLNQLRHCITDCYDNNEEIVFDNNRGWSCKLPILSTLFPDSKIICCVRKLPWIIDSIEKLIRSNKTDLSGIFNFDPGKTVYERSQHLISPNGLIGFAVNALKEGYYSEYSDKLLLIEYDALVKYPKEVIQQVYEWTNIPMYHKHDFNNVEQLPGIIEFDKNLGTPGLHSVGKTIKYQDRQTILPPDIFGSFTDPFWRLHKTKAKVITA